MAIDWGRMGRGIATGYLGAKIANTAANDAMNADIIKRAGLNFYENTLPEFQLKEKNRKSTYAKVSAQYGPDVAEYMDQNDFIVGDASDYKNIVTLLGSNDGINETKLKAYLEATSAGTYTERAEERVTGIQDREKTIMGLTSGSSKIGNMTAELLVDGGKEIPTAATETVTTPAVEGSQVGPVITEAVPEKTETKEIPLPTYEEIFGDTTKAETVYLKMDSTTKKRYQDMAGKIFDRDKDALTGDFAVAQGYIDDYKAGLEDGTISNKTTRNQYIYNRWFEEQFLPNEGISYRTPVPQDIVDASTLINYYNSIGDDTTVTEIKKRLKDKGYDLTDYNL
tara:strand:+ start:175 stop:1191 length:1017 start_codon:yes stop_codon:yes gene_type:complete